MQITAATFQGYERVGADTYRIRVRLTTTNPVTTFDKALMVTGNTVAELRDDASRQIAALNLVESRQDLLASIANGTNIPVTAPAAPAATALETWLTAVTRYQRLKVIADSGIAIPALTTEVATRKTAVESSWQAGFLASL
jgi:hypothetical protein